MMNGRFAGRMTIWLCVYCLGGAAAYPAEDFRTLRQFQQEVISARWQSEGANSRLEPTVSASGTAPCPEPIALGLFKHQIAFLRTEESDPLRGSSLIHADVWMRGPLTVFYLREKLNGFVPDVRMTYVFGEDGLRGGGTCPAERNWLECVGQSAGVKDAGNLAKTCTTIIDTRTIPAWAPSPNDQVKRRVAGELRSEVEDEWRGVQEIVVRDFNLKDNQITMYLKMPDGGYFQGCSFHAMREPHCEGWHLFGQVPVSSLRKRVFEKPYRLK